MLGKQIEGYPPVKQFRKGNLYYMEGAANRYWIGIFKNFSKNSYIFIRVITHDPAGNPSKTYGYSAITYVMSLFKIRKLTTMELSLFINANYKAPVFDRLLTGKSVSGPVYRPDSSFQVSNLFTEDPYVIS